MFGRTWCHCTREKGDWGSLSKRSNVAVQRWRCLVLAPKTVSVVSIRGGHQMRYLEGCLRTLFLPSLLSCQHLRSRMWAGLQEVAWPLHWSPAPPEGWAVGAGCEFIQTPSVLVSFHLLHESVVSRMRLQLPETGEAGEGSSEGLVGWGHKRDQSGLKLNLQQSLWLIRATGRPLPAFC